MSESGPRSTSLCEGRTYSVYLRLATVVSGCLTLVATTLALKQTLHYKHEYNASVVGPDQESESGEEIPTANSFVQETLAFTIALMSAAAVTILLQISLVLASKCCSYIYEPVQAAMVYLKLIEFLGSSLLLMALVASTIGEGIVAYHWSLFHETQNTRGSEGLFKALSGSTAFGFLLVLLLSLLCITNFCLNYSLLRRPSHREKPTCKTLSPTAV